MYVRSRLTIALGLLAFGFTPVAAQMGGSGRMFGIKGGATFATVSVNDPGGADIGNITRLAGGAFLRIPLGGLALQPEVLYMQKGASISDPQDGSISIDIKLDYVEVPVLIVVPIGSGEGAAPYVFGGGAVAFEAGCKFKGEGGGVSLDIDCGSANQFELELQRKKVDFGAVAGAGVTIPAGSGAFLIEGRYTFGLLNIDDSGDSANSFKNRAGAALIGYSFNLGG